MKKIVLVVLIALLAAGCLFAGGSTESAPKEEKQVVITMGSMGNPNTKTGQAGPYIAKRIEELTNGSVKVDLYDQSKLGYDAALIQQCMDGTVQMVALSMSIFSNYTQLLDVVQLPFLIDSYNLESAMFETDEFWNLAEKAGKEMGIKLVGVGENGIRHFVMSSKPINDPSDLNGMIIRTAQSTMLTKAMSACGANANPLAYNEVYTAMQNHIVDGLEINLMSVKSMSLYEVAKYMSFIGMYPYASAYAVNRDFWDTLSESQQNAILQACKEAKDKLFSEWLPEEEETASKLAQENGMIFNDVANKQAFIDRMTTLWDEYRAMDPLMKAFIEKAIELKATLK